MPEKDSRGGLLAHAQKAAQSRPGDAASTCDLDKLQLHVLASKLWNEGHIL